MLVYLSASFAKFSASMRAIPVIFSLTIIGLYPMFLQASLAALINLDKLPTRIDSVPSAMVGPDAIDLRSSPKTSDRIRFITLAGLHISANFPPLTFEYFFRSVINKQ